MEQARLECLVVRERDIGPADPAAQEAAEELQEVRVAARPLHDLADEGEIEGPTAARERDSERVPRIAPFEMPDHHVAEHPLGIRPRPLEVQAQGRQTAQDQAHPTRRPLRLSEPGQQRRERVALQASVVAEEVGFVVQEQHARDVGLRERSVEGQERRPDQLGSVARLGLVGGLIAQLADRHAAGTHVLPRPLDRIAESRERVAAPDQGGAVVGDCVGESCVVAVAIAELAPETEPAGPLPARRELAQQHRLAGPPDAGQRPVRVRGMRLAEIALELAEEGVAAREVWRGDAIPWTKRVGELFGSKVRVELRHIGILDGAAWAAGREGGMSARPAGVHHGQGALTLLPGQWGCVRYRVRLVLVIPGRRRSPERPLGGSASGPINRRSGSVKATDAKS